MNENSRKQDFVILPQSIQNLTTILLVQQDDAYQLPYQEHPYHFWQTVDTVQASFQQLFQANIAIMRCVHTANLQEYYLLYPCADIELPEDIVWVEISSLHESHFADSASYHAFQKYLQWQNTEHSLRVNWYHWDWWQNFQQELTQWLHNLGYSLQEQPQQIRAWERSALWKVNTQKGWLYIKEVPQMFAHEVTVTKYLGENFPELVTPLVDVRHDSKVGYRMLMPEYSGNLLCANAEFHHWINVIQEYAHLQQKLIKHTDTLQQLGVPLLDLNWMQKSLPKLMEFLQEFDLLTNTEKQQLSAKELYLRQLIHQLDSYGIPMTLEHGDFYCAQVIVGDNGYQILDWSDCAITHPFFSIPFFLFEEGDLPTIPQAKEKIREAYLQIWTIDYEFSELLEIVQLAEKLYPLYTALLYYERILPNMEQDWEMMNMLPYYLRQLL